MLIVKYFCCNLLLSLWNWLCLMVHFSDASLFVVQSNANAPACEVIENGARVCLAKYQIVIIEFCVT